MSWFVWIESVWTFPSARNGDPSLGKQSFLLKFVTRKRAWPGAARRLPASPPPTMDRKLSFDAIKSRPDLQIQRIGCSGSLPQDGLISDAYRYPCPTCLEITGGERDVYFTGSWDLPLRKKLGCLRSCAFVTKVWARITQQQDSAISRVKDKDFNYSQCSLENVNLRFRCNKSQITGLKKKSVQIFAEFWWYRS